MADATYNPQSDIETLKQQRLAQQRAQLEAQRQTQLSSLNAQQAKIQPQVDENKNSASTSSQLQAKNFAEYMSQRGNNNPAGQSGTMNQAEISRGVSLQGAYSSADKWGREQNADIERQRNLVNNNYASGLTAAQAGIEADAMQSLIAAKQQQQQMDLQREQFNKTYGLQEAGVTGMYNGNKTLANTQSEKQIGMQEAGLTGTYNGADTIAKIQADFSNNVQLAGLMGTYNGQNTLEKTNSDRTFNLQQQAQDLNKMNTMAQLTGFMPNPTANVVVPDDIRQQLSQYSGNYAQAAKDLAAQGQNGLAQYAQALSNEKLFSDPNLMKKYAPQYQTLQGQQVNSALQTDALQRASLEIDNKIKGIQLENLPAKEQLGLQLLQYQVKGGELDNAAKTIQNLNLDAKLKADIYATITGANASMTSANASASNAATNAAHAGDSLAINNARLAWEKDPTNPDNIYKIAQADAATNKGQPTESNILNQIKAMAQSGKFTPDQQREYIANSALSPEAKARIANQMGIPKN